MIGKMATVLVVSLSTVAWAQNKSKPIPPKKETVQEGRVESPAEKLEPKEERQPKPVIDPATPPEPVSPALTEGVERAKSVLAETRGWRTTKKYQVIGSYSFADLIIPSKIGASISYIRDADRTYELEYLRGSISVPFVIEDLGKMTDERLTLLKRSYFGSNSFNFRHGLSYLRFNVHLGDDLLSRVTGGAYPSIDLITIETLGLDVGIGNRWIFNENIVFGIDWITWTQPVYVLHKEDAFLDHASNPEDRDDVDEAIKWISYMPRFALLKLQLGIAF